MPAVNGANLLLYLMYAEPENNPRYGSAAVSAAFAGRKEENP